MKTSENKVKLNKRDERYLNMSLNDNMWKVILYIGTPLAMYKMLSQIFAILDTMMAAHISKESVSAVAYLSQVNHILSAVGGGLAVGAGIKISHAFGQGDFDLVKKRVSSLYILCLSVGVLMLAGILPFTGQFLRLAGTPEGLIAVGTSYFIVQLLTMVITFLNNVYIAVERARGNAKLIFKLNLMVILTKLSLTAFFVYILNSGLVMIAGHEFGQVTVAGSCDIAIFPEEIEFDSVGTVEVGIHPVVGGEFITFLEMFLYVLLIDREDIDIFIGRFGEPGEMVDADDVGI